MRVLPSIKRLLKDYRLSDEELLKIMHTCLKYYLSEEELQIFIYEYYHKLEMRLNKRHQK